MSGEANHPVELDRISPQKFWANTAVKIHHANVSDNEYPAIPQFYVVRIGLTGFIILFLFLLQNRLWVLVRTASVLLQNTDCGYSLGEAVLTSTYNLCFGAKIRKIGTPLHTPVLLYIKVGFRRVYNIRTCFRDI